MLPIPKTSANTLEPPEGSSLYYSLLYTAPELRANVLHVLTLIDTLERTLDGVREHQVAEVKIHWWHEEIDRLFEGQPRHPETRNCQTILAPVEDSRKQLLSVLSATSSERLASTRTDAAAQQRITEDYQARLTLLFTALQQAPQSFATLALGLGQHHRLRRLATLLKMGVEVFSDEAYQRHNTTPDDVLRGNSSELIAEAIADAHGAITQGLNDLSNERGLPQSLITHTRISRQQCRHWQKRSPCIATLSTTLTPLRKFFIAWRTKKNHA
ncbi:MAG: hypothetical protein KTR35_07030 [Gammaproteobacteria bacterium]|nr:hypothetical protein [Gammaproteobacteria bacterium]